MIDGVALCAIIGRWGEDMDEVEAFAVVAASEWAEAERGVRASAAPARIGGRVWGVAAFAVLAIPVVLMSDGVYRYTNLLYVAVAALGLGVLVHSRVIGDRRSPVLAVVKAAVVPSLVPQITVDQLAMLVLTQGVWVGRVYLLATVGESDVRIVRPPNPSPTEFPGFILPLESPTS